MKTLLKNFKKNIKTYFINKELNLQKILKKCCHNFKNNDPT
jgi:hypothetical protein